MPGPLPHVPVQKETDTDWELLDLLTDPEQQRLWSVEELERSIDCAARATDSLRRLYAAGLIHRTSDGFIFATMAAIRCVQILQ